MIDTAALLDAAKARQAIPSDYKPGLTLGVVPSAVKNYRKGRSRPDDVVARRLAKLAGFDEGYVVACLHYERAQDDEARSIWLAIAERLKTVAAAVVAATLSVLAVVMPDGGAQAATRAGAGSAYSASGVDQAIHCRALLALLRRARALLRRLAPHPLMGAFVSA